MNKNSLYYLASPYSKFPRGPEVAFVEVSEVAGNLMKQGYKVYCPIAHTHPIARYSNQDIYDHSLWLPCDLEIAGRCDGMIIVKMSGWEESYGIAQELDFFKKKNLPVVFLDPVSMEFNN